MSAHLIVHRVGPGVTLQDLGRPGYLRFGLSRGGAADRLALAEGAALLGNSQSSAALEMANLGGEFEASEPVRIALTGAPMKASIDGTPVPWNASHLVPGGARLSIESTLKGVYGYLSVGGGFAGEEQLHSQSVHSVAGLGSTFAEGDHLPLGNDPGVDVGFTLPIEDRFGGGEVRVVASLQTDEFSAGEVTRFENTLFQRDVRGNRMGVRMIPDGDGFHTERGLKILSEVIVPGDIQITGDGTPFVLMAESQTTGGYPRIGSVIRSDLPRVAQMRPGERVRFRFITLEDAVAAERSEAARRTSLPRSLVPLVRDPRDIRDLLAYQLVSGVTAGDDLERTSQ